MDTPAPTLSDGQMREQALRDGGATQDQIDQWKGQTTSALQDGGASDEQIRQYWGTKRLDDSDMRQVVSANLAKNSVIKPREPVDVSAKPIEADDVWDAFSAGFGASSWGIFSDKGKSPIVLKPNASLAQEGAAWAGNFFGEVPAMATGMLGGSVVGAPTVGAFTVPPIARKILMDHYEKGDISSAHEFAERAMETALEGAKGAAIGLATMGAGALGVVAGKAIGGAAGEAIGGAFGDLTGASDLTDHVVSLSRGVGEAIGKTTGMITAETGAMATATAALEGRLPNKDDLTNAIVSIGGLHALGYVGGLSLQAIKIGRLWAKTGASPAQIAEAATKDPVLKAEILSKNEDLPKEVAKDEPEPEQAQEKPAPEQDPKVKAASDEIASRIAEQPKPEGKGVWQKLKDAPGDIYTNYLDYTNAFSHSERAQKLARLYAAVSGRVMEFVTHGTRDFNTDQVNGESYQDVTNDIKKDLGRKGLDEVNKFRIAARSLELEKRGISQPGDRANDQTFVDANPHLKEYADRIRDVRNRTLDYLGASGRYSQDLVDYWKSQESYAPLKKVFETDELTGKGSDSPQSIKEIGDSDRKIVDPTYSDLKDMEMMIKLADRTHVHNAYIEQFAGDEEKLRVSKEQRGQMDPKTQIAGYEDGKRTLYDVDPMVAEALNSMSGNRPVISAWGKIMNGFAQALRLGTVYNPVFGFRHIERGQFTAATLSKTGLKPFQSLLYAPEFLAKSEDYHNFVYDGAAVDQVEPIKDFVDAKIKEIQGSAFDRAFNQIKSVPSFSHTSITLNDNLIRFAEYKRMLERGASREEAAFAAREVLPDYQKQGLQKSALAQLRQTAFLNVHLQGLARMGQELTSNPWGYMAKNAAYIMAPSMLLNIAQRNDDAINDLPAWQRFNYWCVHIANWRQAYSQAEAQSVMDSYPSNVRQMPDGSYQINDGHIVRIEKPFSNGVFFGSMVEAGLDSWRKQSPGPAEDWAKEVLSSMAFTPIPTGVSGLAELATNRDFYKDQPIIPHSMENKLPEVQYDRYTSETAKELSNLMVEYVPPLSQLGPNDIKLGSPKAIDSLIQSFSGTLGRYAIDLSDRALVKAGVARDTGQYSVADKDLSEAPFAREFFIRFPMYEPQSVTDFQDRFKKADEAYNSIKYLIANGDLDGARKLSDRYQRILPDRLEGADKALQNINVVMNNIYKNDKFDPVQKRQLLDTCLYMRTAVAKRGLEMMDKLEGK